MSILLTFAAALLETYMESVRVVKSDATSCGERSLVVLKPKSATKTHCHFGQAGDSSRPESRNSVEEYGVAWMAVFTGITRTSLLLLDPFKCRTLADSSKTRKLRDSKFLTRSHFQWSKKFFSTLIVTCFELNCY